MDDSSLLERYQRVKTTQVEMVRDRGYSIPDDEEIFLTEDMNVDRFRVYIDGMDEKRLDNVYHRSEDALMVVYLPYSRNNKGTLKAPGRIEFTDAINGALNARVNRLIIIVPVVRGGTAAMFTQAEYPALDLIQVFSHDELGFNPTKSNLVPRHELLKRDRLVEILDGDLSLIPRLPGIHLHDPQTKYHGGKLGEVFLIHRIEFIDTAVQRYSALRRVTDVKPVFTAIGR